MKRRNFLSAIAAAPVLVAEAPAQDPTPLPPAPGTHDRAEWFYDQVIAEGRVFSRENVIIALTILIETIAAERLSEAITWRMAQREIASVVHEPSRGHINRDR